MPATNKTNLPCLIAFAATVFIAVVMSSNTVQGALAFTIGGSWDSQARADSAWWAMTNTVNRYNVYGDFGSFNIWTYYDAGIPTAQASYLGSIGFGGTWPNDRVAQHESNHYLGSGTYWNWYNMWNSSYIWTGVKVNRLIQQFDGDGAVIRQAGVHFYGYGLNYDNEVVNDSIFMRNIAIMYAMRQDMGNGVAADPWSATDITLTASDQAGTSAFNWFGGGWSNSNYQGWSDKYFAHPGAAYFTGDYTLRTPLDTYNPSGTTPSFTFAGDSLTINNSNGSNGGLSFKGVGATGLITINKLTLDGGYVRHASGSGDLFQLAGSMIVKGNPTIDAAQGSIKISATIAGIGSLTKAGNYALTLTGSSSFSGNTVISGGTLRLAPVSPVASYTFDNISGSTVVNDGTGGTSMNGTLSNGATIVSGGRSGNAVSLSGGASVDINSPITDLGSAGNWTISACVKTATAGGSILTKSDGSGWTTGNTIFYLGDGTGPGSGGIPSAVRYAGGFFQGSASATSVTNYAWHQITYVNNAGTYAIYVDGVAQPLSPGNSNFGNADVGSIVRLGVSTNTFPSDGTGNFNGLLDNVQFYNQALSASQVASLQQGSRAFGSLPTTTNVTIASGAVLDLNGALQQIGSLSGVAGSAVILGNGRLTVNSANSTTFAGGISGIGGSIVKSGTGTLTLSGVNTYTSGTAIDAGTLKVANNAALGIGAVTLNGSTLSSDNNYGANYEPTITNAIVIGSGNIAGGQGTLFRVNGNILGTGPLGLSSIFNGSGLRLAGNNSQYTGTVTVTGANTRLGAAIAGSAAAKWFINGNLQTDVVGGATFQFGDLSGTGTISGHANNASSAVSTLSIGALNTNTIFSGMIIDNAADDARTGNADGAQNNQLALTKVGTGMLTLSGTLSYTGNTTVLNGVLNVTALNTPLATVGVFNESVLNAGALICNTLAIGGSRVATVPEPSTLALLGMGLVGLIGLAWQKRKT